MTRHFSILLAATLLCAGWGLGRVAQAQSEVEPGQNSQARTAEMQRRGIKVYALRVKNVPPSIIAWWLDSAHQPEPALFRRADTPMTGVETGNTALPTGVERIVAIDPQNAILVFATEAGIKSIRETVEFLDQPLRQVEIEAQFVQISAEDARQLGIESPTPAPQAGLQINFLRANYAAILKKLAAQNKVKITPFPRVLAINNAQASLSNSDEMRLLVTPTLNNDDSVTLSMSTASAPKMTMQSDKPTALPLRKGIESIVNVRDGDTIVLSGSVSDIFPRLPRDLTSPPQGMILVTPRIVRRSEDARPAAPKP